MRCEEGKKGSAFLISQTSSTLTLFPKKKLIPPAFGPPLSSGAVRVLQGTDSREEEEDEEEEEIEEDEELEEEQSSARVVSSLTASSSSAWPASSTAFSSGLASPASKTSASAKPKTKKTTTRKTALTVGRRVAAQVRVAARPSTLWRVLTDFEALPSVVPNLEACEVIKGSGSSGSGAARAAPWLLSSSSSSSSSSKYAQPLRIRQRASSQCRWWRLEAEALLEVTWGDLPRNSSTSSSSSFSSGSRELRFEQVEGDFRELAGRWVVSPIWGDDDDEDEDEEEEEEEEEEEASLSSKKKPQRRRREPFACVLTYELLAVPRWPLPPPLVSAVVAAGLPANIAALASAAEAAEAAAARPASAAAAAALEADAPLPGRRSERRGWSSSLRWEEVEEEEGLASSASFGTQTLSPSSPSSPSSSSSSSSSSSLPPPVALPAKGPPRMQAAPWPTVKARVAQLSAEAESGEEEEETEETEEEEEEEEVNSPPPSSAPASAFFPSPSRGDYLGVSSVPLPLSSARKAAPGTATAAKAAAAAAESPTTTTAAAAAAAEAAEAKRRRAAAADAERLRRASYPAFVVDGSSSSDARGRGASSAAAAETAPATAMTMAAVSVHLRRLDPASSSSSSNSSSPALHRRAVAEAIVAAPPSDVWAILTDYEALPDIVPSLAACELLAREEVKVVATGSNSTSSSSTSSSSPTSTSSATTARARIRQVAYKRMQYVELHAEALLDVAEREGREVQFRQVRGDFDALQGKWMVVPLGSDGLPLDDDGDDGSPSPSFSSLASSATSTLLRYAVEVKVSRSAAVLRFLEPLLEAAVAEDVPRSLAAIGAAAERRARARMEEAASSLSSFPSGSSSSSRPRRLPEMAEDFEVLAAELRRCFGERGAAEANAAAAAAAAAGGGGGNASSSSSSFASSSTSSSSPPPPPEMPTRAALRALSRGGATLERAIAAHGGAAAVGARLGWLPPFRPRKPAGYWDSAENLRTELSAFVRQQGLRPGTMPTKTDMRRAGRRDLLRAVERRGGIYAVAQELFGVVSLRPPPTKNKEKESAATTTMTTTATTTGFASAAAPNARRQYWRMPTRAGAAEWSAHLRAVAAADPELRGARLFEVASATFSDASSSSSSSSAVSAPSSAAAASQGVGIFGGRSRAAASSEVISDSWDSEEEDEFDDDEEEEDSEGDEDEDDEGESAEAAGLVLLDSDENLLLAPVVSACPPPPPKSKSGTRKPPSLRDEIDQW